MALRHKRITSTAKYRQSLGMTCIEYVGFYNAPHAVRSLRCVGGTRPRTVHSIRRLNRKARELGFQNWEAYMVAMTAHRKLLANLHSIAASPQNSPAELGAA